MPRSELLERQREDVEPDVATENRIGDAERHAVPPRQPRLPAPGRVEADDDGEQRRRAGGEAAQLPAARQRHLDALRAS